MKTISKKILLQGLAAIMAACALTATANAGCPVASLPMGNQLPCPHTPVFNPDAAGADSLRQGLPR